MTSHPRFRLLTLGAAKALTKAPLPYGELEGIDPTDRWGA